MNSSDSGSENTSAQEHAPSISGQDGVALPSIQLTPIDGRILELSGWRQGAIISNESVQSLLKQGNINFFSEEAREFANDPDFIWVIITQSCDLVHVGVNEPMVEVILLKPSNKIDSNFKPLKNPRKIQLQHQDNHMDSAPHWRLTFSRDNLLSFSPESHLESEVLRGLRRWLSRRYKRSAFSGKFDARWKSLNSQGTRVDKKISKLLEILNDKVLMILIEGNVDKDLPEEDDYSISVIAVTKEQEDEDFMYNHIENPAFKGKTLAQLVDDLSEFLNSCNGIEVTSTFVESENTVSYKRIKNGFVWDTDALSEDSNLDTSDED
ncbi:hypothetical protein [Deinococcus altitudinis]|uniref:hypothetical protein n=1 Tax=Deinococcus altitudinis TaxID=468914 RepID=UPI0038922E85